MTDIVINIEIEAYRQGKRKKQMTPKQFIIKPDVWETLQIFKETDLYGNKFSITKSRDFMDMLEITCTTMQERHLLDELKNKVVPYDYIHVERQFVELRGYGEVLEINGDYAQIKNIAIPVRISDKAKYEGIKVKDKVEVTVLKNGNAFVTAVTVPYDEEKEKMGLDELDSLIGDY